MTTLTAGKISSSGRWAIRTLFSTWREKAQIRRNQRQDVIALRGLSKAALRDIGIDASEISSVVYSQPEGRRKTHDRF